jgi:hypothetical protein
LNLDNGIPEDEICVLVPQWWLITSVAKKLRATLSDVNFDASGLAPMSRNRENIWYKLSRLFLTKPNPKIYSARYRWATELIDIFSAHEKVAFKDRYQTARNLLRLINSITSSIEKFLVALVPSLVPIHLSPSFKLLAKAYDSILDILFFLLFLFIFYFSCL